MDKLAKVLIIIPAYNEEKNLKKLIAAIETNYPQFDYVIINDGSNDNTEILCKQNSLTYIDLPINSGIGVAVQTGYKYAYEYGYDIAIQIDGDGQHGIEYLTNVIEPIVNGEADITIGSRFLEKKGFQSSFMRRMGIVFLSQFIALCTGVKIKDVTSGYRAANKDFIKIYANDYSRDYPEPEAIVTAVMHHARIQEMPVEMKERQSGVSSINFGKSIYYMIKVTLAVLVKRISYGIRR